MVDCLALFSCCRVANTLSSAWVVPRPAIAPKQSSRHLLFIFLRVRCWVQFEYDLHAALDNMIPLFSLMVRPFFPACQSKHTFVDAKLWGKPFRFPFVARLHRTAYYFRFPRSPRVCLAPTIPFRPCLGLFFEAPRLRPWVWVVQTHLNCKGLGRVVRQKFQPVFVSVPLEQTLLSRPSLLQAPYTIPP